MFLEKWLVIGRWNKRCGKFICQPLASRPKFDVRTPKKVHQTDSLFLPDDTLGRGRGRQTYKYALAVVDFASHYKKAEPSTSKEATEIAGTFRRIYTRGPLKWPEFLQVDPRGEFIGVVTKLMKVNGTTIRRGRGDIRRDQAIVERLNRTVAELLFGYQYAVEMHLPEGMGSRLPDVVSALNNEVTDWLIGKKPAEAIKEKAVAAKLAKQTCQCRFLPCIALNQVGSARFCLPEPHKT